MDVSTDPSLVLKITPPKLRKSLLDRERLRRIRADDIPVFLVEAPPGHGKTSLLAQWRLDWLQAGAAVAWLSLDAEDSPITVVSGIVLGLRRSTGLAKFGIAAVEAVRHDANATSALTSLLAEISESAKPTVIVFDNCERVGDPAVREVFDYLLHNLPPNLQIAAGSRPTAPLHTTDLFSEGKLSRVTAADLRFDLAETIRLLSARLGERNTADLCARLYEVTDGWPLGLQLAAAALERAPDPVAAIETFSVSRDDATTQLFDGMLQSLPPVLVSFLTRCALLDALHPSLCEAVTGDEDAALSLQRLLVETPLLTATEDGEWLRLHPLAREYLRTRAERTLSVAERQHVHFQAWKWLAARGLPERAAEQALAAGCDQEAYALIAKSIDAEFNRGHVGTVLDWLARVPPREVEANLQLRVIAMWTQALSYRPLDAIPIAEALMKDPSADEESRGEATLAVSAAYAFAGNLDTACEFAARYPGNGADSRGRRALANLRTYFSLYEGAPETARQAQAMSPDDGRFPTVRVWGDYFIGLSYLWEGRPILADQSIRQQHDRWERHVGRRGQWAAMLASVLAVACWQRDQRDDARALLAHRLDVIDQTTGPDGIEYLYRCLAQMAAAEGDDARAMSYLEALAAMSVSCGLVRWRIVSLAERVRLHSIHQRPVQAASSLADLDAVFASQALCSREQPLMHMELALARTYAALAERDMTRAGDSLGHAWTLARKLNRGCEIVQIMALQALLANRSHESPSSLLLEALSRAETGDLVRAFADTVPEVIGLVRQLAQHGNHSPISRAFIDRVLAAADVTVAEATRPVSKVASAILTPKEDEVLRLLAADLPNKRIAAELGLSSETVKWHVKKLFAKLNAGSRDHAVERARMLGLIS